MKQRTKAILLIITVILPLLILSVIAVFIVPPQYKNTFLAELSEKYTRLKSIDEPKIILVGGSNLAFGLDSRDLEKETGLPVVNFGLYASLGTKAMMDLSKSSIHKGDIVVLCPELDAQTLSLYYNGETMWQALDCNYSMLLDVGFANYGKLLGSFPAFASEKFKFYRSGKTPNPKGVYQKSSFNKYGDIVYKRKYNNMMLEYDPTHMITLTPSIVDEKFVAYVNQYASLVRRHGAKIYFSFPPMDKAALEKNTTDKTILSFYQYLGEKLNVEIISNINGYLLDSGYFYDTNFHLNDTGVKVRTSLLAEDVMRAMEQKTVKELSFPPAPIRPKDYFETVVADDTSGFFTYKETQGGVMLSGVTPKGVSKKEITIPSSFEGKPVLSIQKGAFSKCQSLKIVIVGENSNIKQLYDGTFRGAKNLERVEIHILPGKFSVGLKLLQGTKDGCKVVIPRDLYGDYATDYIWSQMMSNVTILE